jgi:hypothetical protein
MEYRFSDWVLSGVERGIKIEPGENNQYVVILRSSGVNIAYGKGNSVETAFNKAMVNYHNAGKSEP